MSDYDVLKPASPNDHPLRALWLVHNYYGPAPWRSILDLSEEEAHRINGQTANISSSLDPTTGQKETYYRRRSNVEAWDRTQHMARGGAVESINPVYAGLTDKQRPSEMNERGGTICFPAEWIEAKLISITFGESFSNYDAKTSTSPGGFEGRSYSADQFAEIISQGGMPKGYSYSPMRNPGTDFIEVRLYTRYLPTHEMVLNLTSRRPNGNLPSPKQTVRPDHI